MTDIPIALQCGVDWFMDFVVTDPSTGNPINVTTPKMEIRGKQTSNGPVLFSSESPITITLTQPVANQVHAVISSANSKNILSPQTGYWDAYATRVDTGAVIQLGTGTFTSTPNTTAL